MKRIHYILLLSIFFLGSSYLAKAQEELTLSFTIDPVETLKEMADIKLKPSGADASNFEPGRDKEGDIKFAYDNDMNTFYHSSWNNTTFPITLNFHFTDTEQIDYIVYNPRVGGSNGNFKEFELYYINQNDEAIKIKDYDFQGSTDASTINLDTPIQNPKAIRFVVKAGVGNFASCAEMEFYTANSSVVDLSQYFVDDIYSAVKPGVTKEQILGDPHMPLFFKYLAIEQLEGRYSPYRVQTYEAYRPYKDLEREFKTSTYNQYENPTGIFLEAGKQVVVFVPDTKEEVISLISRNWDNDGTRTYALKTGINYITPTLDGNSYISYYTNNYKTAEPIKIHIYGGGVNGVFYAGKSDNNEWKELLANAASPYLDMVGQYVNLTYYVTGLKQWCPNEGVELLNIYDEIIKMQFEQMGLFKYNKVPKNHMFGRNTLTGFMSAGGIGANFQWETLAAIGNAKTIARGGNSWGIAHEFGHVNQIRPGLRWIGTVECTNNVYSSYAQYVLQKKYDTFDLRLEHENCMDIEEGAKVIGGRFNSHLHYGVLKGDNWLFQWGQDGGSDHFVKLVPLWQLNMYFKVAEGTDWRKPDWYADICEETRNTNDASFTNGRHQINFMKRACAYTATDLVEFFEKAGMLKPIDRTIDDYGDGRLIITEEMCKEVRDYVAEKGWKKPAGVINYISGNTINIYEQKLAVEGTLNEGVSGTSTVRTIDHKVWKNAVVYETYKGNEITRLTMAGTGTKNNSSTSVPYPAGSTKIVAVSWDGKRTTVYEP